MTIERYLRDALKEFKGALAEQGVYDEGHQNLDRAYRGAQDFVRFLLQGPSGLSARPPRLSPNLRR